MDCSLSGWVTSWNVIQEGYGLRPGVGLALFGTVLAPDVTDVRHDLKVVGSLTLVSRQYDGTIARQCLVSPRESCWLLAILFVLIEDGPVPDSTWRVHLI